MRIAMVAADDVRRDGRAFRHASALAAAGHRVTVYGVLAEGAEAEEDVGDVVIVRTRAGRPVRPSASPWSAAKWFERLEPVARLAVERDPPEALHSCGLAALGPASEVAARAGVPLVHDAGDGGDLDRFAALGGRGAAAALRRARRRATLLEKRVRTNGLAAVIAESDGLAAEIERRHGAARPTTVRNCVSRCATDERTDALRVRIGVYPTDRVLLFHGVDGEGSGDDAAVRALPLLGDDHVLVFLGRAARQPALERVAARLGVGTQVRFVPGVPPDETWRFLASADVALLPTEPITPSLRLGLPSRLFEALAAGAPVVATDLPEVGALVRRTGAGVLCSARSPQDPAALAEGVHTLVDDASLHATCREQGMRAAAGELSWEKESERLLDLYDAVEASR